MNFKGIVNDLDNIYLSLSNDDIDIYDCFKIKEDLVRVALKLLLISDNIKFINFISAKKINKCTELVKKYDELVNIKTIKLLNINKEDLFREDLTEDEINSGANLILSYVLNKKDVALYEKYLDEILLMCNPKVIDKFVNLLNKRCNEKIPYMEKIRIINNKKRY